MGDHGSGSPDAPAGEAPIVVGLLAAPGLTQELAEELAAELPALLRKRFPEVEWQIAVQIEPLAGSVGFGVDLVQVARRRLLTEKWKLVVCLTDLPLHLGRRPVTAYASAALGVGLVSVPALGVVAVEGRARRTVLRLIEGLLGESVVRRDRAGDDGRRTARMRRRLRELAFPVGRAYVQDDRTVRFVTAAGRGNLRLLAGMVRANRPWRLVVGLSRTIVAALGTSAFALASPGIWLLAGGMGWARQLALFLGSIVATCVTLIIVHRLWEREPSPSREARERVVLFNLATALTIAIGVLTLFVVLLVINLVSGIALIAPDVLEGQLHREMGPGGYLRLAWLVSALATVGGALGAAVESDVVVREAAYGYRPDERTESDQDDD
jgi:putative flippase GtrA